MNKHLKRALSVTLCAAMSISVLAVGASATNYTPPTTGVVANDNIITGTGNRAGSTSLQILGVNATAVGDKNGVYDGSGSSDNYGADSPNLGTFGSDVNDNPDPYLYNFFYNLNTTKFGGSNYDATDYASWNATPYTLIGASTSTTTIDVGGVTKTCSPFFFYEPDVHINFQVGMVSQDSLNAYKEVYDEDNNYNPLIVNLDSESGTRTDGLGNIYNMFQMSANLAEVGTAVSELADELGKTTRYADSAQEIGGNYDKWSRGFYYWAQLMFEVYDGTLTDAEKAKLAEYGVDVTALGGGLEKVRGVRSFQYSADTDSWTILNTTSRQTQYASGIVDDVYDVLTAEIAAGTRDSYVLTTDELISYLQPAGQEHAGVIVSAGGMSGSQGNVSIPAEVKEKLTDAGIRIFANLPTTVYGITMQARENALGQPYYLAYFYYDQLAAMTGVDMTLNPISLVFYWMKQFYHVSDTAAMQTVIVNMLEKADLPAGLVVSESATTDNFGSGVEAAIENMIVLGIKYYLAVEEPRLQASGLEYVEWAYNDPDNETDSKGSPIASNANWAYWFSLRMYDELEMGIGSGDIYLNPEGNGVENRHLNAQALTNGDVEQFYTLYSSYIKEGTLVGGDEGLVEGSGDINGDDAVNATDAVIVLRAAAGTVELTDAQVKAADVIKDGEIKTNDAAAILQMYIGLTA